MVVVLMVVCIAWWACVDVLFLVLFHTRLPMVVGDVFRCVFHTQVITKHSAVQLVHHPSTFAPCQSPTTPCLSAYHTHQSITLLPQVSFLLLNVVIITIVLVTIEIVWL